MLDRHHLTILHAIHTRGTLTEAAQHLHLSQSALSHAIKKLEQQVGTRLWRKEGRKLQFTEAGHLVLELANRLLPQFEHTETLLSEIASGGRGSLRIGMECHPCYRWLLRVVKPYLQAWPKIDVDVRQKFQFGGIGALFAHDIDLLVTPDPLYKNGLDFEPVFAYEQVLVLPKHHPLAKASFVSPQQLSQETLLSYPVEPSRLDIYQQFFLPANCAPAKHRTLETTELMLQLVAAGRGVAALPQWLAEEYAQSLALSTVRLGEHGIAKHIYLGTRSLDTRKPYLRGFVALAKKYTSPDIEPH